MCWLCAKAVIWSYQKREVFHKLEGHNHDVCGCHFSPDGSLVATCSYDTRILIWDTLEGICLKQLRWIATGHWHYSSLLVGMLCMVLVCPFSCELWLRLCVLADVVICFHLHPTSSAEVPMAHTYAPWPLHRTAFTWLRFAMTRKSADPTKILCYCPLEARVCSLVLMSYSYYLCFVGL